ncbi:uncharacterized protein LOC144376939 [Ictidomys tridecemlineatus]
MKTFLPSGRSLLSIWMTILSNSFHLKKKVVHEAQFYSQTLRSSVSSSLSGLIPALECGLNISKAIPWVQFVKGFSMNTKALPKVSVEPPVIFLLFFFLGSLSSRTGESHPETCKSWHPMWYLDIENRDTSGCVNQGRE